MTYRVAPLLKIILTEKSDSGKEESEVDEEHESDGTIEVEQYLDVSAEPAASLRQPGAQDQRLTGGVEEDGGKAEQPRTAPGRSAIHHQPQPSPGPAPASARRPGLALKAEHTLTLNVCYVRLE